MVGRTFSETPSQAAKRIMKRIGKKGVSRFNSMALNEKRRMESRGYVLVGNKWVKYK